MTTNITITIELTNATHMTLLATLAQMCTEAHAQMHIGEACVSTQTTSAPVQAPAPVEPKAPKTYAPAEDIECVWVHDKTHVTYTLANGKYVGTPSARKVLNERLRNAGATWDGDKKVWKFASTAKAKAFVEETSALVKADEIDAKRAQAQARAERKAQRG